MFYEAGADEAEKAQRLFPAHWARCLEFRDRGLLLHVGTFRDRPALGAMGIFSSRAAAEEFIAGDPFVLEGVVEHPELRDWEEAH
jgi:uncharacterized protein YciI